MSEESAVSDSDDIFDTSDLDNAIINLELRLPAQNSSRNDKNVYVMSDGKRGRCLIINNCEFKTLKKRIGSEVDVNNLTTVFKELRFHVIVKTNISTHAFIEVIDNEMQHPDHENLGMFVLIIMSHGGPYGRIYGADDGSILQHVLLKRIYNCETLKGKPKFIVIQACAGNDVPKCEYDNASASRASVAHTDDSCPPLFHSEISELPEDVLILRSSFDGFVSLRFEEFGSPFVRALVEALYKHSHNCDVEALCKRLQGKMRIFNKKAEKQRSERAPLPSYSSFLSKKLYLFPCIASKGDQVKSILEPQSLAHLFSSACSSFVYSVSWLPDRSLACGFDGKIEIRDEALNVKKSHSIAGKVWTVCHYGSDYLVLIYDRWWKVNLYSNDFAFQKTIIIGDSGGSVFHMAVKGDKILVIDNPKRCVKLFTANGVHDLDVFFKPYIRQAWGIQFQEENSFIVSDDSGGKVLKFMLEANSRPVWTCKELSSPRGISIDASGFIYVSSSRLKTIYILTPSGTLMKKFSPSELHGNLGDIPVLRNYLAVGSLNGIQLFEIRN